MTFRFPQLFHSSADVLKITIFDLLQDDYICCLHLVVRSSKLHPYSPSSSEFRASGRTLGQGTVVCCHITQGFKILRDPWRSTASKKIAMAAAWNPHHFWLHTQLVSRASPYSLLISQCLTSLHRSRRAHTPKIPLFPIEIAMAYYGIHHFQTNPKIRLLIVSYPHIYPLVI